MRALRLIVPLSTAALAAVLALGLLLPAASAGDPAERHRLLALPQGPDLGGETTQLSVGETAFALLAANAGPGRQRLFSFGNRLFNTNWTMAPGSVKSFDGLGPIFNRVSCSGCHVRDGRGQPPAPGEPMLSMLTRLSVPGVAPDGGPNPHPAYGDQLGEHANPGIAAEGETTIAYREIAGTYADGTPFSLRMPSYTLTNLGYGPLGDDIMISPRVAPAIFGVGLLEAVPEATLLALADPDDADGDGISGRINARTDPVTGVTTIGRFGWKASQPSVAAQNSGAAIGDIGLTSSSAPAENCTSAQAACAAAITGGTPEISDDFMDRLNLYTRLLAVPAQRHANAPDVTAGASAFRQLGCAACHMPTLETRADPELPELANQTIHPFTDLLLHDVGEGLADHRPDYLASGSEWRTAPLWGLGLIERVNRHNFLLHDGRARGIAEAILWHGGEAERARENFRTASPDMRAALLAYLNSL